MPGKVDLYLLNLNLVDQILEVLNLVGSKYAKFSTAGSGTSAIIVITTPIGAVNSTGIQVWDYATVKLHRPS
eukprot:SAG31_NODE_27286_length_428_cov_1.094225_2_plen_72_part_00